MNRTSTLTRTYVAAVLAASAAAAQATTYDITNSFDPGWVTPLATIGNATFVNNGSGTPVAQGVPGLGYSLIGSATAVWNGKADFFIGDGTAYVEWAFPGPQNGFGGTFSFPQDPSGSFALSFVANDSGQGWIDVCANCVLEGYSGFFGFTSASPFNGVRIFGPGSYTMTDVSVGAVPLPAAVWLFASALGLAGVSFHRRRQQS